MTPSLAERVAWTLYLARQLRGQSAFSFSSSRAIVRAQNRRLRAIVQHAFHNVPYYRETMRRLGLTPRDFTIVADLRRLPVIEREELQGNPERFRSDLRRRGRDLSVSSGGSTGAPRVVTWDTAAIFQNAAHAERERSIIARSVGRFTGYRETVIASPHGSEKDIQKLYLERAILPRKSRVEYQHLSLIDSPAHNAALINEFRPDVIRSYGSYLDQLFGWMHTTGANMHLPRAVFFDADELPTRARELITDHFGVEVFSAYQAVEAFKIGFECEKHVGYHLNEDIYPVRLVDPDGRDVPPGESGEVIVSNLVNRATVLLNYRLGDVARVLERPCACGRTLPLMSFIEGRTDDWVALASGESVHPQSIRTIFTLERAVRQYQVVQHLPAQFSVAIESPDADHGLEKRIRSRFAERFGEGVNVEVKFVDQIEPNRGGKLRPVISHVRGAWT